MVTGTARDGLALALAVGLLVVALAASSVPTSGGGVAPGLGPAPALSSDGCASPFAGSVASGALTVDGGPLAPSASRGVPIAIGYSILYEVLSVPNGTPIGKGCLNATADVTTDSNGSFAVNLSVPATTLVMTPSGWQSTRYFGPWGPVSVALPQGAPSGYALSVQPSGGGLDLALAFVWELASVSIVPTGGTVVVSAGAPFELDAEGWMANGTRTPLSPTFAWTVTGVGWALEGSDLGSAASVLGASGAPIGTVSVRATAYAGSTLLDPPSATANLVAVTTEITAAQADRTLVDAGTEVTATIQGTGAPGYAYSASVSPGLGLAPLAVPCTGEPALDGLTQLTCTASWAYPTPGTAQPSGNLSNGFSTATWQFPSVTVAVPPDPSLGPAGAVGYAGLPLRLEVSVANGSGILPYAGACLGPGDGQVACEAGPGPWAFAPVYPAPGTYSATAWTTDAVGTNRSVSAEVRIVGPLAVGPVLLESANVTAGVASGLAAVVTGGVLPAHVYWNVTGAASASGIGTIAADGSVVTSFTPAASGIVAVTVAVVDALGTVARASAVFAAAPAPASAIVVRGIVPVGPVPVGSNLTLSYGAVDATGAPVPTYATPARLVVRTLGAVPEAWVNATGVGPLADVGGGTFVVPASAWANGALNLTVVAATVGTYSISLVGAGLPGGVAPVNLSTTADLRHVRLYDPAHAASGSRDGSAFWLVEDRFGNPAPGAVLRVEDELPGASTEVLVAAAALPNGSSGVWINYSVPGSAAGSVVVVDAAGVAVLGPISVAAVPSSFVPSQVVLAAATVGPLGAAAVGVTAFVRRRRGEPLPIDRPDDEELVRWAEGRESVVATVRRLGAADLAELGAAWTPAPAPPDLADWVSSLVADGTLRARVGADRRPRFCLASPPVPPRVEVDAEAFEAALRRRDEDAGPT